MTRKLTFYRWIDSAGVLWNIFPSPLICKVRFDQRKQTWAIRWCCSLMTLETAICMLSNIATTSRILSSNDGAANIWKETLHYISPDEVKVYMKWHISNVNSVIYILKQKFRKIVSRKVSEHYQEMIIQGQNNPPLHKNVLNICSHITQMSW